MIMDLGLIKKNDFFDQICDLVKPVDYFDFPSTLIAFAESLKKSELRVENNGKIFFRQKNKRLSLITFFCTSLELMESIHNLIADGFQIKVLNWVNKDFEGMNKKFYSKEFWVLNDYNFICVTENHGGKKGSDLRRYYRKGEEKYELDFSFLSLSEVLEVFYRWIEGAKKRHFMVLKGHYLRYIERYFECKNNVEMIGFRDCFGDLYGICGYEIFNGMAQITLMKHKFGDYAFPKYFWVKSIENILEKHNVRKIFCGSTADDLKILLGMCYGDSWKIVI